MYKRNKSLFAVSLGIAISSQGVVSISHADSLNSNSDNDVSITNGDDVEVKVKLDSEEYKLDTLNEAQVDPEKNKTYSMGGNSSVSSRINENSSSVEIVNLSNPKAIGSGNALATVNIRSEASTSGKIIGTLNTDETIEILGKNNDWYKVDFNGKEGYVSSSYLKLNPIEKGIDVSKWNGSINWKSVKASGIDYVIIRAGYGTSTVDPQFKTYIEGARNAGLKIGVYWFSYATSPEKAIIEAQKCLETISPYKNSITYPVFFDFEYDSVDYANKNGVKVTKNLATSMANAFIDTIESQGYSTGIYTNKDFSSTYYTEDLINSSNLWVAQYSSTNTFGKPYSMWQYSEKGIVPGISGYVDLNYTCLKTFGGNSSTNDTPSTSTQKGVTTANVNFRNGASTSSSIIATIPKDTTIEIIDKSTSGWYKVEYKGVTGYVSSEYVTLEDDTNANPSTSTQKGVTTANVNFRNSTSTSSSIIATIPKDTTIEVIDKSTSGWYKVEYKGVIGYVSSEYVALDDDTNDNPSTSTQKGVTTANVNFRNNASTSSSIIATIPKDTTVEIIDKSTSGWYKIEYKGVTGYVSSEYVTLDSNNIDDDTNDNPSTSIQKGVTTANVNFRNSASTSSSIIATIPKDTTIEIIDKSTSGWYKIEYKGVTGYVSSEYVTLDNASNKPSTEKGITTANVNFRKSASTSSSILATIPKNTTVEIIDKSTSGWYKVEYKGVTGYVSNKYITLGNANDKPSTSTEKGITTDNVNFRKSASTSSSILATIPKNTTVEIIDKSTSGWYKVEYKGSTGYISSTYVTLNNINTNNSTSNNTSNSTQKGITTANLNLRKSTSASSSILATIPKNTTIEIIDKSNSGWYKVKYKSLTGYVSGNYIKI